MTKPPTQVAGVIGIAAAPVTMNKAPALDWRAVVALPPFQMYAAEAMRNVSGKDSLLHAMDFVESKGGGQDVFDGYAEWHAAKGHWPNETPMGEVKR